MKIAQVIFEIGAGGAEIMALTLSEQLVKQNHQVDLIRINARNDIPRERIEADQLNKIGIHSHLLNRKLGKLGFNSIIKLIKLINKEKYDFVHSHLMMPDAYVAFAKILCHHKFTHIITVHSASGYHPNYLLKSLFRHSTFVKCSPAIKKLNTVKKEYIVLNAVDIAKFSPKNNTQLPLIIEELKLPSTSRIIISVGNLRPEKNQSLGIKMMQQLIEHHKIANLHYVICGHGPELNNLKNEVENLNIVSNVHFLGARDDIPRLLQTSDFFVNFSTYEGLPLGVLEAFASGIIAVLSPIEQHSLIGDNMSECYFPKDFEVDSFVKVFCELYIKTKSYSKSEIFENRKELMEQYSLNNFTNKYLKIYKEVINEIH